MNNCSPLSLEFGEDVPARVQARMDYAFRVFAAIYGHEVVDRDREQGSLCCFYGDGAHGGKSGFFHIPARYVLRTPKELAPAPLQSSHAQEEVYLFHGRDEATGQPDWLGEIFEWLSAADEMSVRERDAIGRIPYRQSLFARHGISPLRPQVAVVMAWFENFICGRERSETLPAAPSPLPGVKHLVISSHDIDFYFAGRWGSLVRVVKNLGIAVLSARSFPFFRDNFSLLWRMAKGERVGDFLPELLKRSEAEGFSSTFFVLARRAHRRDANYLPQEISYRLREIPKSGSSVALHGSYCSIVENSDLDSEVGVLESLMGERPIGSRQHWLRFDGPEKLFANVDQAGLQYDSSWGWADQLGFRNGAAFSFPPYDFTRERAHDFLSIPLIIMDQGLQVARRDSPEKPGELAETVLEQSRRWGWGGVSVLWHNPVEALSTSDDVNRIFWQQVEGRAQHQERWISAEEFLKISLPRYQAAGLLKGLHPYPKAAFREDNQGCRFDAETVLPELHPGAIAQPKCS